MPDRRYDVIVLGLGAMGSAAVYQLARRGVRVLGLERFAPLHALGSSHGETRIIRMAYFEHPDYVPLLRRAYQLWQAVQAESGELLLFLNGGLFLGQRQSAVVDGSLLSARTHDLAHDLLTADEVRHRWPAFQPREDEVAVWEPDAGYLWCERSLAAFQRLATVHGADLRFEQPVADWSATDGGVQVRTGGGEMFAAERLVLTAGPWMGPLLAGARGLPGLRVERSPVFWLQPGASPELFAPDRFPVYVWALEDQRAFYGIPHVMQPGVKVAHHHGGVSVDPDAVDRTVSASDEADVRGFVRSRLPGLDGPLVSADVCLYTNTPDEHFVIDQHPEWGRVVFAGGFSGHGFKFAPLVGELLADLATTGQRHPAADFLRLRAERFARA